MENGHKFKVSGFPEVGEKIELPNIAELLHMPWFMYASVDDAILQGGEVYKNLIDKIPLKNDKKYITVTARVNYLNPDNMSIRFLDRWHTDSHGYPYLHHDRMHLLVSDCTALTEFNTIPFLTDDLPLNIHQYEFNKHIEENKDKYGIIGRKIEPNRVVTFDHTHAHRAVSPQRKEFRFMLRVVESDYEPPMEHSRVYTSYAFKDTLVPYHPLNTRVIYGKEDGSFQYPNVEQTKTGVIIHNA